MMGLMALRPVRTACMAIKGVCVLSQGFLKGGARQCRAKFTRSGGDIIIIIKKNTQPKKKNDHHQKLSL
jgi:hypothetical protein